MALSPVALVVLAVVSTAVVWKGSVYLESTSEKLADHYGLPATVQGAVVAAIGSSFPELSSAVLATLLHGSFDLGVAAIVGSAIFNILVIPAGATISGTDTLGSNRELVYKEAQFYMISVAVLLITFSLAAIYFPVEGDEILGSVTRPLAVLPMLLYGLYVFIQYQETSDYDGGASTVDNVFKQWALLGVSLVVILVSVEGLVRAAIGLGEVFGTPSFLWGLTVVAAGTSLPDAFVSIKASKKGDSVVSVGNVLGSNIFDLLIAVPAGIMVAGATTVNFSDAVPMMGVLIFATIVLFTFLRTELEITNREAYALLFIYCAFIAWLVLETAGVTSYVV